MSKIVLSGSEAADLINKFGTKIFPQLKNDDGVFTYSESDNQKCPFVKDGKCMVMDYLANCRVNANNRCFYNELKNK